MTVLSKEAILEEIKKGNIIFTGKESQIQNQSIDVSLGSECIIVSPFRDITCFDRLIITLINKVYRCLGLGSFRLLEAGSKVSINKPKFLKKGTFFLAYTNEFVGTRIGSNIHCQFQQTSTSARLGLIHPKAGWGDVGFMSRWAMEFFVAKDITIQAGDIVGQMSFTYTTPTQQDYAINGQYQKSNDLELIQKEWKIENILPKKSLKNIKNYE